MCCVDGVSEAAESFCVKRIYAGGDQSFAHYALPEVRHLEFDRLVKENKKDQT